MQNRKYTQQITMHADLVITPKEKCEDRIRMVVS